MAKKQFVENDSENDKVKYQKRPKHKKMEAYKRSKSRKQQ